MSLQPDSPPRKVPPLSQDYRDVRRQSIEHCAPLNREDYNLQAEDFTSPPKWHLAHTSWFFETFLLKTWLSGYRSPDALYETLFNSYYNGVGEPFPRPRRGLLSRPTLDEILDYRMQVDEAMERLLGEEEHPEAEQIRERTRLGIEHEQQHQELFFTDFKHSLFANPLLPAYRCEALPPGGAAPPMGWLEHEGGLVSIGHRGSGFCFDNELPRHRFFLPPFRFSSRLVTNREYAEFIADGGYCRPDLWLADGWSTVQSQGWEQPAYWLDRDGESLEYTLQGLQRRDPDAPVCHVSGYEADAFARWAKARLPTEFEWETVAQHCAAGDGSGTSQRLHPASAPDTRELSQLYGECWQWTQSAYLPYPGFRTGPGAIGEYNGKFMSNQWVLRGSSCVTAPSQARYSYRNFFYPQDRWQFTGIRLAGDAN